MAIPVYIEKRFLKERRRNGTRKVRYVLRWEDPETGKRCCESTATSDRTEAEGLQKMKWAEVNGLLPAPEPEPEPEAPGPTWDDCRVALQRAMEADNKRPSYVSDALSVLDSVRRTFPEAASPADVTPDMANEYKRRRAELERGLSPWTIRGDVSVLKAVFGKWLGSECGLLKSNPFENVKAPRCDDPDVRIVSADETADLFAWLANRWNDWRLPLVYLEVAAIIGWRATEIASMKADDVLADGFIRVRAESSKTRKNKFGRLPEGLHAELKGLAADGWAFGRFSDELRRLLYVWKLRPHHAAKVKGFTADRLVGWMQDELQRYNDEKRKEAAKADPPATWEGFTLHDFRRTAITGLQMAGATEKETSIMVGATPEVIRKHYEKMDQMAIASRNLDRRYAADGKGQVALSFRACSARGNSTTVDTPATSMQTAIA
jgi:integrase